MCGSSGALQVGHRKVVCREKDGAQGKVQVDTGRREDGHVCLLRLWAAASSCRLCPERPVSADHHFSLSYLNRFVPFDEMFLKKKGAETGCHSSQAFHQTGAFGAFLIIR